MNRTLLKLALLLAASLLIIGGIVYLVGWEKTRRAVEQAGLLFFLTAGAMTVALLALQSAAWAMLNRAIDHRVGFRTLLEASTVGMAAGIVTPSAYLGGEPLKVVYVGRKTGLPYHELAGTVVLAKYLEALSFVLSFGLCTVVAAVYYREVLFRPPNVPVGVTLLVVAGALLVFSLVLWLSLSRRWTPLTALVGMLGRLRFARRFFAKLRARTRQMEEQVSRVFREEGRTALRAFGFLFLSHVVVFVKPGILFYLGWRVFLGLGELSLLFVALQALLAFQLTPSSAGTLDGGMLGTFALLGAGISDSQCMAWLLCLRVWDFMVIGVGSALGARVGAGVLSRRPPAVAQASNDAQGREGA